MPRPPPRSGRAWGCPAPPRPAAAGTQTNARRLRRRAAVRAADHDAARVQVIIQCPALAQKLRREQQPRAAEPAHDALRIADRHRGLDDHEHAKIDPADERKHRLDGRGVEEVAVGVIIRRRGDDDHVGRAVGPLGVRGRRERQRLCAQEVRDLISASAIGEMPRLICSALAGSWSRR